MEVALVERELERFEGIPQVVTGPSARTLSLAWRRVNPKKYLNLSIVCTEVSEPAFSRFITRLSNLLKHRKFNSVRIQLWYTNWTMVQRDRLTVCVQEALPLTTKLYVCMGYVSRSPTSKCCYSNVQRLSEGMATCLLPWISDNCRLVHVQ